MHNIKLHDDVIKRISRTTKYFLLLPSAIARSHLTRLVLIALELKHQGAEVVFAFLENNQILQHYNFQFFPVADAVNLNNQPLRRSHLLLLTLSSLRLYL